MVQEVYQASLALIVPLLACVIEKRIAQTTKRPQPSRREYFLVSQEGHA